ncbi:MAG: sugar phosphate isomerase/epimerase [Pirellulales bacterium]|nr:sugar phosphate isomerase/epimerase [Pirellulales bacterium]
MATPTLFSVSYAGLWGQHRLDLVSFLHKAGQLGYRAVELMGKRPHLSVLDIGDRQIEQLREAARGAGVEIATIAGYTNFTLAMGTEIPATEIQVAYVRWLAQLAKKLDAKIIRVFTGYTTEPEAYAKDWDACVRAVRECADMAAEFGVVLGVQNHHDVGVGVDSYIEFLDEVGHPNCRAMFDPWSPALHGTDLRTAARRLAPRMVQTTLADYVRLARYAYQPGLVNYERLDDAVRAVPLGQGFLDLDGFFAGLKEGGFDGYVAYEMCSPLRGGGSEENLDRTARASLERIRQLVG